MTTRTNCSRQRLTPLAVSAALLSCIVFTAAQAHSLISSFPLTDKSLVISRPTQPTQPFTVAGQHGVLVGTQDGQFESWILPVKLLSHLTIEADLEGYSVPIAVNPQSANIEVRPDQTTLTYSHIGFTIRQIMFSPDEAAPGTGPVALFQIDAEHPLDLTFRFTPEMRWMWPKRNQGVPSPEWVPSPAADRAPQAKSGIGGYYILHLDYPDLAGAITIPTATPGILAPYQERPQVHPLELHLHYDPKRDGQGTQAKFFPLLMAVGTTPAASTNEALGQTLSNLNQSIPEAYKTHAARYAKLLADSTFIETPDKALNEAFQWGLVSIEQLKAQIAPFADGKKLNETGLPAHKDDAPETALVAGYYASGDSARPGFGWFFGRDALYTLYAVNSYGDFALTRAELEFLIRRQRSDGKIMHEFSQTANDPAVDWSAFPYMYAAADATPLFLMAMRDYYRASGDQAFLEAHKEAIEKAWAFETAPTSDTDHDGIYDNSQGTGWVESWPHGAMPHQEIYLALLDEQASRAYAVMEAEALGNVTQYDAAIKRADSIHATIEKEYYDPQKGCYAFSHNLPSDPNGETDKSTTVYPAIAWWDASSAATSADPANSAPSQPVAHPRACLEQFASPTLDTDWGLRDVATTEPFYDGMSYHQGSVWPLFTGWAALAEYRGNQPLAGEQMLMQNVDLTWAQDPGAVTELLSGDFFIPFGRSTSHQLWSSAMVLTPTLRGLFGINVDAATNTITVNPHLPAEWMRSSNHTQDNPQISNLHIGDQKVTLLFYRESQNLQVELRDVDKSKHPIQLRSDMPGTQSISKPRFASAQLSIPLPPIEPVLPDQYLPTPGSRTSQIKVLSTVYGPKSLALKLAVPPDTDEILRFERNQPISPRLSIQSAGNGTIQHAEFGSLDKIAGLEPIYLRITVPKGQGYQALEFTLTW